MASDYMSAIYKAHDIILGDVLKDNMRETGYDELVSIVAYRMVEKGGKIEVEEYLVTIRKSKGH